MSSKPSTADTIVLTMAEDAYLGDAQFIITVDGVQVGGTQTALAAKADGATQNFTVTGDFGAGPHVVGVTYLNDAFGGAAGQDRNLYFEAVSLDGTAVQVNSNVGVATTQTITAASAPVGTDTVVVNVAEDAWDGDAQFRVFVDGVQVGTAETATASHADGDSQDVTLTGNFGTGPHSVTVRYVNDAYGGSASADRNLYVNSITYDGSVTVLDTTLMSVGNTTPITVSDVPTVTVGAVNDPTKPVSTPTAPAPDTLVLYMAEDAYLGDAKFDVIVDGVAVGGTMTVTASNADGQTEAFTLTGDFGAGPHNVTINYLNDKYGGSLALDRNLYLKSTVYDGVAQADGVASLFKAGAASFTVQAAAAAAAPDTLTLYVSEDAYEGNAQFSVTVDGKAVGGTQTATGSHNTGGTLPVTLTGSFGAGPHTVVVTFLNDLNGGSVTADRNLYVSGIVYDNIYTGVNASLYATGSASTTVVGVGTAVTPLAPSAPTPGNFQLLGVNLSGLEFGGTDYAGTLNTDYVDPTHAEIDYYASKGMNVIRLPFDWERVQPVAGGPLNKAYLGLMDDLVSYAATKGVKVDLDMHDYGQYYNKEIGTTGATNADFNNVWSQLASHYAGSSNVMFGLMNEPYLQTAAQWLTSANGAIAAIRAAGATQEILVSGTHTDGGVSWTTSDNASVMDGVVDPDMNFAFEIHQYLDADGSGTSTSVVSPTIGVERLTAVTQWAEATGNRLFLGEFGSGSDAASLTATQNMLTYMAAHTDAWQGATEWGGGPWWGNYGFATDPTNGVSTKQINLLQTYTPSSNS